LIKKILRLKIADFLGSEIEDNVMSFLQMVRIGTPTFTVVLWYITGDIDKESLLEFRKKYKEEIETLELDIMELKGIEQSVWYDIIHTDDVLELSRYKFRSIYENKNDIINCIMEFNSMIKFDTKKNTGYKNVKDRNHRFKTVGKQTKD